MKRCYFGVGLLAALLLISLGTSWVMNRCHGPISQEMSEAASYALADDWKQAVRSAEQARKYWEQYRELTAALADHEPMEQIDRLFGELEVWQKAQDAQHCATVCAQLSEAVNAMADAHALTWWNVL